MMKLSSWNTICAVLLLVAASGQAQTFNTIIVFDNADGLAPIGSLVQSPEGNLYGTAGGGGGSGQGMCFDGCGLIFKVTSKGELTTVHAFCKRLTCPDGFEPYSGLVLASDGNFYGTTYYGGIARLRASGASIREISAQLEVSTATVHKALQQR
jgi:hypothetical protein